MYRERGHLLAEAYGWQALSDDHNFGEPDAGGLRVMLSRNGMAPRGNLDGVIPHHYVEEVAEAVARFVAAGAERLHSPQTTDWRTEATYLRGPGHRVVDVCRDA